MLASFRALSLVALLLSSPVANAKGLSSWCFDLFRYALSPTFRERTGLAKDLLPHDTVSGWRGDVEVFDIDRLHHHEITAWGRRIAQYVVHLDHEFALTMKAPREERRPVIWADVFSSYVNLTGFAARPTDAPRISELEMLRAIYRQAALVRPSEAYYVERTDELTPNFQQPEILELIQEIGRKDVQRIELNFSRPTPRQSVSGAISPAGLVFFTKQEILFGENFTRANPHLLLTLRCFHPQHFMFEISFWQGRVASKHAHL